MPAIVDLRSRMLIPLPTRACFLVIVIAVFIVRSSGAFNLETSLPVIKRGNTGSYFGYAVAAHRIRHKRSIEGLILVGAPLDKNLQPKTRRSGALWKCPMTDKIDDCVQVITDGRRDVVNENKLFPPLPDEIKENQWLGVTVRSQGTGGKVMVCAHRYKMRTPKEDISGLGLCYVLKQDLEFENAYVQCKGRLRGGGQTDFGVCQSGTSAFIFDDDNAIIGAPGSMTWRGAIFVFNIGDDYLTRDKTVYVGNGTDNHYDDDNDNDKDDDALVAAERIKKYGYMGMSLTVGYFNGNNNAAVYVAGAPRANETGQVVLFRKSFGRYAKPMDWHLEEYLIVGGQQIASNFGYEVIGADVNGDKLLDLIVSAPFYFNLTGDGEGGAVYVYLNEPIKYLRDTIPRKLTGKLESRFGFAMSTLGDLNKDGFDDIAIGAPYEGNGVVYVYFGSKDGLIETPTQVIRPEILATSVAISTFGYSLSGGVDLDGNGYPDLVIGAYENDLVVLLRTRPVIDLITYVKSSSNLTDFDPFAKQCKFNDKIIYNLPCFNFQMCCVINSIDKINRTNRYHRRLYVNYKLEAETFDDQRTASMIKWSRIWFDDSHSDSNYNLRRTNTTIKSNKIEKTLEIDVDDTNREICQTHVAVLKENTRDIQSPIRMKVSYSLNEREREQIDHFPLTSLDYYPILNQQQATKIFSASFLKNCGSNNVCESHVVVSADFSLEPLLYGFDEGYPNRYQYVLGESEKVTLNVTVNNFAESAYETILFVYLPEPVALGKLCAAQDEKKQYVCGFQSNRRLITCEIGNPLKENESAIIQLELDFHRVNVTTPSLEFNVVVNTTSENRNFDASFLPLKIRVVEKIMLSLSGVSQPENLAEYANVELKGESSMRYKDEIGNNVTHLYTIMNYGPWPVYNVQLEIDWPYQVANNKPQGKWLLYLDEGPEIEGGKGKCGINERFINPLKLIDRQSDDLRFVAATPIHVLRVSLLPDYTRKFSFLDQQLDFPFKMRRYTRANNRTKRDTEMIVKAETYKNEDGKAYKIVKMNCLFGSAKCHKFVCILDSIESKQFINVKIKSRLWDSTLIEDYRNIDQIRIASRIKMHIPESKITLPNIYSNEFQIETRVKVTLRNKQLFSPVPFYILIVSVIIGLLLFILLTILLWKIGFFKRRRPDPTLVGNLERRRLDIFRDFHDS